MNDTTRRFLSAISERVPQGGRIVELRLFPAIRQGGIESGVAVVAVDSPIIAPDPSPTTAEDAGEDVEAVLDEGLDDAYIEATGEASDSEVPGDASGDAVAQHDRERVVPLERDRLADDQAAATAHQLVDTDIAHDEEDGASDHDVQTATTYIPNADTSDDDSVGDALDDEMTTIVVQAEHDIGLAEARAASPRYAGGNPHADASMAPDSPYAHDTAAPAPDVPVQGALVDADDDSPYADAPPTAHAAHRELLADAADTSASDDDPDVMQLDDILALPSPEGSTESVAPAAPDDAPAAPRTIQRYAILTASYRLTLKGPDRGKWDVDMTHEADAPLATVERVARGVAKRSGDGSEPEHFSGESLQQALDAPAWLETT